MSQRWKEDVLVQSPDGAVITVSGWLARATMDIIGEGKSSSSRSYTLPS